MTASSPPYSWLSTVSEVVVMIAGIGGVSYGGIGSVTDVCCGLGEEVVNEERGRVGEIPQTRAARVARAEREQPSVAPSAAG